MNHGQKALGLDFSLTGTGWVLRQKAHFTGNLSTDWPVIGSGVISTKAGVDLYDRCSEIVGHFTGYLHDDTLIAVEDYAVSKFGNAVIGIISVGAIFRFFCRANEKSYCTVPPTTVKKFTTGKGVAQKDLMMLNVYKKWGFTPKDNNDADAYAICQMLIQRNEHPRLSNKGEQEAISKMVYIDNTK